MISMDHDVEIRSDVALNAAGWSDQKQSESRFVARNRDKSACMALARLVTERMDIIGNTTMISIRSHHLDEVLP